MIRSDDENMKLTIQLQMLPDADQAAGVLDTMKRFNAAASFAAKVGFEAGVTSQPGIHKRCYVELRERFSLSAQMAVRAIGKAVEALKGLRAKGETACPEFKPHGAITYDERILSFKGLDKVSLWTLAGRMVVPLIFGEYQGERIDRLQGQVDLVYRGGKFYLYATVEVPEETAIEVDDFIGVDLGIVNLATDSTGEGFSGADVERNRRRRNIGRKQYQRKGTKRARRRLKQMAGRQRRFQAKVNHEISKKLVVKAKALNVGIAMEDLSGIRDRVEPTVDKRFRRQLGNWGFSQLRHFVEYKAKLAGVPVVTVDPHNSSRTCSRCGHCEKGNRRDRATFCCKHCGYSSNADLNAAENLRIRGLGCLVNQPQKSPALAG
jgi:IS605 OrfB family transposase